MKLIKMVDDVKYYELMGRKISDSTLQFKMVDGDDGKVYRAKMNGDCKGSKIMGAVREFGIYRWEVREDWAGKRIEKDGIKWEI